MRLPAVAYALTDSLKPDDAGTPPTLAPYPGGLAEPWRRPDRRSYGSPVLPGVAPSVATQTEEGDRQ